MRQMTDITFHADAPTMNHPRNRTTIYGPSSSRKRSAGNSEEPGLPTPSPRGSGAGSIRSPRVGLGELRSGELRRTKRPRETGEVFPNSTCHTGVPSKRYNYTLVVTHNVHEATSLDGRRGREAQEHVHQLILILRSPRPFPEQEP
jgi:hypothetical protein